MESNLKALIDYRDRDIFKPVNKKLVVYSITNIKDNKVYIGISRQVIKRIGNHLYYLKHKEHKNYMYIHKAINAHGIDNFVFKILEVCIDEKSLKNKEVYWVDFYKSNIKGKGYNLTSGGELSIPNEETTLKKINSSIKVKVAQYNLKGELLNTFISVKEASRVLNISDSDIHRCSKKNWSRNNFMFKKYKNKPLNKIPEYKDNKASLASKSCKAFNKLTNETFTAKSMKELAIKIGICTRTISILNERKTHKKWDIEIDVFHN